MFSLLKKEINSFFGSLTGYVAIIVFLLMNSLFLWVFPGNYNILDSGYATLDPFFSLAPWLYLFLIPAITMRLFAEEKRLGTIETLLTKPIDTITLIFSKYLAGFILVLISLLPTLIFFFSVFLLGDTGGNIDIGATWGSYTGLLFLASIYLAIGLFTSSLTDNQVVAFITALVISFIFYLGFEFIGSAGVPYFLENIFTWMSINEHYLSISRGVVDIRDIIYFVGMTVLFLYATKFSLKPINIFNLKRFFKNYHISLVFIILFLFSGKFLYQIDLTSDKRYSLTDITKNIISQLELPVEIDFYLEGELQPGLRKVQRAVIEKVSFMDSRASKPIRLNVIDPYELTDSEKRDSLHYALSEKGIQPTSFRQNSEEGVITRLIFPGAIVKYGNREVAVNFLKSNQGFSYETNFNHSVESIEFELVNAFRKLFQEEKPVIGFLEGHNELNLYDVADISYTFSEEFEVVRITPEDLYKTPGEYNIVIIAGPIEPFNETDKFAIDQYIMQGGKTMWLIDPVLVSLDSLTSRSSTIAVPCDLNLNDQLFKYGVRLNYDLLQDVSCSMVLVNTALPGNPSEFTPQPWYYSPLLVPGDDHEISRNLNQVMSEFVSSIDTLIVSGIKKTVILSTSPNSRKISTPVNISLDLIDMPVNENIFNQGFIPTGILLEGIFPSVFQNRMVDQYNPDRKIVLQSSTLTKMIILSDASIIANSVDYSSGRPLISRLGYDEITGYTFGNEEFIMNAVYYLNDKQGIMQLRNRTIKLRLLDKVKLQQEKLYWQWINVLFPVICIAIFGFIFNILRYRRFTKS